jgi:hypothetical protein
MLAPFAFKLANLALIYLCQLESKPAVTRNLSSSRRNAGLIAVLMGKWLEQKSSAVFHRKTTLIKR